MPAHKKLRLGYLIKHHPRFGPLRMFYLGKGISCGDVVSPTVPYEDYTFDENNICPEEYARERLARPNRE